MASGRTDFSRLKFLIIDDFASFCSALRTMVQSFGVKDIDIVHHGEEAVRALHKTRYDVVLCDYNLGEGKNGNDVLEESRQHSLLKSSAIYIMLTAENASEMVRGALEYQPDDYLTKPFTKEVLQVRLMRLLERNRQFTPVFSALDHKDTALAITQCNQILNGKSRYTAYCLKLKAQLLFECRAYGQACELFQQVLKQKPLPWAKLGLGKSYFYLGQYPEAEAAFLDLIDEDRGYVQAWDWLARCQEQKGDTEGAQLSLQEATKISPVNVRRQVHLGDLAQQNGDVERAERAYNRAVKVGKHSVFRSPDSYMKLTELLINRLDGSQGLVGKQIEGRALSAMEELRGLYKSDSEVQIRSRFADHRIHSQQGHGPEAEKAIFRAYDICTKDEEGHLPGALKEQLITRLEEMGRSEMAGRIIEAMQQEESTHNTQAVSLYDQGDLEGALEMLRKAVAEKPRSYAICLNTAQVAIHSMVKKGADDQLMELAESALGRAANMSEEDRRYNHYQSLLKRLEKLKQSVGA